MLIALALRHVHVVLTVDVVLTAIVVQIVDVVVEVVHLPLVNVAHDVLVAHVALVDHQVDHVLAVTLVQDNKDVVVLVEVLQPELHNLLLLLVVKVDVVHDNNSTTKETE